MDEVILLHSLDHVLKHDSKLSRCIIDRHLYKCSFVYENIV